jgi:hypothetical protein
MGRGYYQAAEVINEALYLVGDSDRMRYAEAALHFMAVHRDFSLFHTMEEKEAWMTVNTLNNTVALNDDTIRVLSVGLSINGEFFSFTESSKMTTPSDATERTQLTDRREDEKIDRAPYSGYGTKGLNTEYYYSVDYRKRRINLNRVAIDKLRFPDSSEVLVRYVSNDIDSLESTRVAMDAVNMLISYIVWKLIAAKPKDYSAQYRAEKKDEFLDAEYKYRLLSIPDVDELMDTIYETSSQNVRI